MLQAQTLDAEQKKLALGASTIYNVIQDQQALTVAESNEVAARADYARAKVELDRRDGADPDEQQHFAGRGVPRPGVAAAEPAAAAGESAGARQPQQSVLGRIGPAAWRFVPTRHTRLTPQCQFCIHRCMRAAPVLNLNGIEFGETIALEWA